jgi:MFS family permease
VVIWTVGEVIGAAVGPSVVADLAPAALRGRYQGVFGFSFAIASLVAPLAGGWTFQHLGGTVLWMGCLLVSLAAGAGHLAIGPARGRRLRQLRDIEAAAAAPQLPTEAAP